MYILYPKNIVQSAEIFLPDDKIQMDTLPEILLYTKI